MVFGRLKHRLGGQRQAETQSTEVIIAKSRPQKIDNGFDVIESRPPRQSPPNSLHRRASLDNHHHTRKKHCCSAENVAYVIFFILLIIYMALQIIMYKYWGESVTWIDNETNINNDSKKQFEDDGYVFIFQILLAINVTILIPKICKNIFLKWRDDGNNNNSSSNNETKQQSQKIIHIKLLYKMYLPAYLLATSADWLQGPYKYALYSSYGYSQRDIAHLFVAGYGSGMILGSIVGGLADQYGRKKLCICYCLCYMFSVSMKHFKNFYLLLLGRVAGGIATSLLFSVFESWLIGAHIENGLTRSGISDDNSNDNDDKVEEEKWLSKSFAYSTYGSSLVAIGSGVLANIVVENSGEMKSLPILGGKVYYGGYVAAFDTCIIPLILCCTVIMCLWEENYGGGGNDPTIIHRDEDSILDDDIELVIAPVLKEHSSDEHDVEGSKNTCKSSESQQLLTGTHQSSAPKVGILSGIQTVWNSPMILSICIIASAFEGSMYIFIFLWTPVLTQIQAQLHLTENELPFGWIFSSFMCCCMLGTIFFSRLSNAGVSASKCLAGVLLLSALSCIAMSYPSISENTRTGAYTVQYIGMLSYEFSIGAYYPAISVLKGMVVPEDQRATIYNVFRLPLNLLVLINLTAGFSTQLSFLVNAILLLVASILQIRLVRKLAATDFIKVEASK
jgi:MFS family permease